MANAVAILAGGCFWGVEELLRGVDGVKKTTVGYTGGILKNPSYKMICTGTTGHAEAIRIEFDPSKLAFSKLLTDWFFKLHDPTTLNKQGNDIGSQYRSAIFYSDEGQKKEALGAIEVVNLSGFWKKPLVTEVVEASEFYPAEDYHQEYLQKNPNGYTCHYIRSKPQT